MKLRLAILDDQEAIARLHCVSWEATFIKIVPELVKARGDEFPRRMQQWGERLRNQNYVTYLAVDTQEKIIGFGQGSQVRDELEQPQYDGELTLLYVSPEHKGQGIGKRLINKVARTLKEQGKQSLVVAAWSINTPAKNVYQHLGAKYVKELVQEKDGFNNSQTIYVWQDINSAIEATL
jgi:ribosomal protein S18 acetylase RimI-like enzyme